MRRIVITGTRKGIGKSIAEYFVSKGEFVIGCSRRGQSISHPNYVHYTVDVTKEKEVIFMVKDIQKKFKNIEILINNAGVASMNHLLTTPLSTVKKIFETNFYGTFLFLREVGKVMIQQKKGGRIINISSIARPLNLEGEGIYAASKAAIETLTKVAAKELAPFGITVNAIGPTPIQTDLLKHISKEKLDSLINLQAIKKMGSFEDIINAIEFFIKENSDFITGQVIYLGGIS